ncbi:MAG: Lrp/AsnC family transcriptional regulator [Candidatus Thermoplasmatota archaeon]|nr:Lrp/AsnC family transcriptional regulator [Candidatus Thermoplasmatota archaeon]
MVKLDKVNRELLAQLQRDARTSYVDLADAVGRAESTVRERIERLEADGILLGYHAAIDPARVGLNVHGLLHCDVPTSQVSETLRGLKRIPEVTRAMLATGGRRLVVEVQARDLSHLSVLVDYRLAGAGLEDLKTQLITRTPIPSRGLPLEDLGDRDVDLGGPGDLGSNPGQSFRRSKGPRNGAGRRAHR